MFRRAEALSGCGFVDAVAVTAHRRVHRQIAGVCAFIEHVVVEPRFAKEMANYVVEGVVSGRAQSFALGHHDAQLLPDHFQRERGARAYPRG